MRTIELLIKPVSYLCNLDCGYCFYKKTRNIYKSPGLMDSGTLEKLVISAMEYTEGGPAIFSWQGGEPLLAGREFYENAVALQARYGKKGQIVSNNIQTNGILIDSGYIELFKSFNMFLGLSLDGPAEIHNFYRKYPSGKGTFREVMSRARTLKKNSVQFNVLSTVGEATARHPEKILKFFIDEGLGYAQFIPAFDRKSGRIGKFSITPETYGEFMCRLFDEWWNFGNPEISVRFFDNVLEILSGFEPGSCSLKKQCGDYLVVEHNGDVYPCDFFVDYPFLQGNIHKDSFEAISEKVKKNFGALKEVSHGECFNCRWKFICNNGCLWNRMVECGSIKNGAKDYLCTAYKKFFEHSFERLKILSERISRQGLQGF